MRIDVDYAAVGELDVRDSCELAADGDGLGAVDADFVAVVGGDFGVVGAGFVDVAVADGGGDGGDEIGVAQRRRKLKGASWRSWRLLRLRPPPRPLLNKLER